MTSTWRGLALVAVLAAGAAAPLPAIAQGYDPRFGYGDDRPPPRPRPPDDEDGYRPPPPRPRYDEDGFRRPPPPPYSRYDRPDGPMMCRTEEGSCRPRGPDFYRARCFCDFGDGPVRGRVKP